MSRKTKAYRGLGEDGDDCHFGKVEHISRKPYRRILKDVWTWSFTRGRPYRNTAGVAGAARLGCQHRHLHPVDKATIPLIFLCAQISPKELQATASLLHDGTSSRCAIGPATILQKCEARRNEAVWAAGRPPSQPACISARCCCYTAAPGELLRRAADGLPHASYCGCGCEGGVGWVGGRCAIVESGVRGAGETGD